MSTTALLQSFFMLPLVTLKIVAAIHWEALRLWLEGARLVPRPNAAAANAALDTTLATGKRRDYTGPALPAPAGALRSSEGRNQLDRSRGAWTQSGVS